MKDERSKSLLIFGIKAASLLLIWVILDTSGALDKWQINRTIIHNLVISCDLIMSSFGFDMVIEGSRVGILDGSRVNIGSPCNALDLMYLFTALISILPGKVLNKIIYIIFGLVLIHLLNIIRVCALLYMANFYPTSLEFNHVYTFTLIIYVVIFSLWIGWNKKFAFYPEKL